MSVRHYAGNTDKLLCDDDNKDISDTGYSFMSKDLILAIIEFVNDCLRKVHQHWHLCFSASVCLHFFSEVCVRSAFRCK